MLKSLFTALALIACSMASTAFAQSPDYSDGAGGGEAPTLVMPGLLTSPISSGLDSDGYGGTGTTEQTGTTDTPSEVPYSVEGEEQLDPETN
jgi:hypothetical protein